MLEIKNLTKTYVPKKGVPVVALKDINLKIEENGLVFILGKSGSGKSTLLNLLGGLDKYDEGDILIKGKSTKDFTQGDFDSYRNTYVGFIFQEYNILEEFSVGANIALAIELQGRKASNEEVNKILDTLDLTGFGNRRPNELSGGQRQRVAIARALVKNPDIILADEPTGALDSRTGLQIFEILKKLSKEKLVIVVSHDREFAEMYGDRVIELADGKVISDITKKTVVNEDAANVQYVAKDGLVVKEGYKLTDKDLKMINDYLEKHRQLNIVTKSGEDFRTREVFVETEDINLKSYTDEFKMIKSRLPGRMAFRMGASGLKYKKFRLFFTILLSLVAFTLFGVADSLAAYNKVDAMVNSIIDGGINAVAFSKRRTIQTEDYERNIDLSLSKVDITALNNGLGKELGLTFKPVYTAGAQSYDGAFWIDSNFGDRAIGNDYFYLGYIAGLAEYTREELEALGFVIEGEMPTEDDEIAITDYLFQHFDNFGYSYFDEEKQRIVSVDSDQLNAYSDLIGKTIRLRNYYISDELSFKVTAVVNTNFDTTRYEQLKNPDHNYNYYLSEEFRTVIQYGYHALGFVNSGLIDRLIEANSQNGLMINRYGYLHYFSTEKQLDYFSDTVDKLENLTGLVTGFFNETKTRLGPNEILVDFNAFLWAFNEEVTFAGETGMLDFHLSRINDQTFSNYSVENYREAEARGFYTDYQYGDHLTEEEKIDLYIYFLHSNGFKENPYGDKTGEDLDMDAFTDFLEVLHLVDEKAITKEYYSYIDYNQDISSAKIVGVFYRTSYTSSLIVIDDEFYSELEKIAKPEPYKYAIAMMPTERSKIERIAEFSYEVEDGISYPLQNSATPMLAAANDLVEQVAKVFIYVGLGFAAFSALMLSNFIATSVSMKKREIGILRAIGARSNDVFRIFFNESIIIAVINFFLSSVSTFIAVRFINQSLRSDFGLMITIFNFSLRQIGLVLIISFFVALAASFIPVYRTARKKPVDAIHNK